MNFEHISGNEHLIKRLTETICGKGIGHAYILESDYYTDKFQFAKAFAKAILCEVEHGKGCENCLSCRKIENGNHEDIFVTEVTEKGSTKDEEIYLLQEKLLRKPFFGDRNIAIIKDADTMTVKAQNRLLKTLEEPNPGAVIILLSNNIQNLTQTILSRCVIFRINNFQINGIEDGTFADLDFEKEVVQMLLNQEPYYRIKSKLEKIDKDKDSIMKFLDGIQMIYRDILISSNDKSKLYKKSDIGKIIGYIEEARRDLQIGVSPMYLLKNMILKIGG